jgi:hypothetical protein
MIRNTSNKLLSKIPPPVWQPLICVLVYLYIRAIIYNFQNPELSSMQVWQSIGEWAW